MKEVIFWSHIPGFFTRSNTKLQFVSSHKVERVFSEHDLILLLSLSLDLNMETYKCQKVIYFCFESVLNNNKIWLNAKLVYIDPNQLMLHIQMDVGVN